MQAHLLSCRQPPPAGGGADEPELESQMLTRADMLMPAYWRSACPELHCEDSAELPPPLELPPARIAELQGLLQRDGYFVLREDELQLGRCCSAAAMRDGVESLRERGWQATFLTMYDEPWLAARHLSRVVSATAGGPNELNADWLGYHVMPPQEAGMPPHRDFEHCPADSWHDEARSLPRIVTVWIALSDCGPENSCLYFLPARCDPGYRREGGGVGEGATEVFRTNESFQDIVCCPLRSGECVVFSHRVFHWGSASTPHAREPRVAIAFGCSDRRFKRPYIDPRHLPLPPLPLRLALNAAQMLIYNKRHDGPWPLTSDLGRDLDTLQTLFDVFRLQLGEFDETYARTVFASPVLPALQQRAAEQAAGAPEGQQRFVALEL
eukprot:TRINITY_DN36295_c0_g1_i1.p1 TRINITY_DN36295_c0_g1~~TRINITY_DN36295_c0_g1_i1.p1  ORF type:complete len:382 (+),score=102.83 TRINITY_DN36295_c0_g1_i1:94-1239(+)